MKNIFIFLTILTSVPGLCFSQTQSRPKVDIRFDVPLIPQPTDMSCWATSAAMVIAWRDGIRNLDPASIVNGKGKWVNYFHTGLRFEEIGWGDARAFFKQLGLTGLPPQCYSVEGFAQYLQDGPLWVAIPGHAVVVTGIWGDGTPEGTMLYINDPWDVGNPNLQFIDNPKTFKAQNKGEQRLESFEGFTKRMEDLAHRIGQALDDSVKKKKITTAKRLEFFSNVFYVAY